MFFPVSRTITSGLMDALPNLFFRLADHPGGGRSSGTILARLNGSSFPSVPKTTLGGGLLPPPDLTHQMCDLTHVTHVLALGLRPLDLPHRINAREVPRTVRGTWPPLNKH